MFDKVLVGYDGSDQGRDAVRLGRALFADGGQMIVAAIFPFDPLSARVGPASHEVGDRALAEKQLREVEELPDGTRPHTLAHAATSRAGGLHELAESYEADLIVVGSSHRGSVGRVLAGSVSEQVLHSSPCAVAVAPVGYAQRSHSTPENITVAIDGQEQAAHALTFAARLASAVSGGLRVITVVDSAHDWSQVLPQDERENLAGADLRQSLQQVRDHFPDATGEVLAGDPARRLMEESEQADVLVLGSRGYGPVRRVLMGSVAASVVRDAHCPVLVVPRGVKPEMEVDARTATGTAS